MTGADDTNRPAEPDAEALEPWERARRARQAQIDAEQAHGESLISRYGRTDFRERLAAVGHAGAKRRRRR
jgi:hypothetical protein